MKTLPCLKVGLAFLAFILFNASVFADFNATAETKETAQKWLEGKAMAGEHVGLDNEDPLKIAAFNREGNTAWMITATALVLFMTLPGLALFYGGLVQSKNVLSVLMHCFAIACLASIIWVAVGPPTRNYSTGWQQNS